MSYPQGPPGNPGYPPAQQPNAQFAAPTQQFSKLPETEPAAQGATKLPLYLAVAVGVLGLLVYLSSFGPQFTVASEVFITPLRIEIAVVASVLAALIAGVGLLPKQTPRPALVGVLSLLSFLLVISIVLSAPSGVSIDWGLYLVVAFTAIQAIVGVGALLLDAGIITAPTPRPKYEQQPYGQYPGSYYGQPPGQPQHGGPSHQQPPQQQRPGYPSSYPGSGYPSTGPNTGGFPAVSPSGPPTPPTGFPTYGQPPASNAPTTQVPTQHQSPSSSQSGQSSS
jgi:hypothetical protein